MHKETKHTSIPKEVKDAVFERDKRRCIICGSSEGLPNAHVVRRSQGGLGVERNIVTLCPYCHRKFDEDSRSVYQDIVREYLEGIYPDWDAEKMKYRKYGDNNGM